MLQIVNLISAIKITEDDINCLLSECDIKKDINGVEVMEAGKRKTLLPFVCEEIFYSTEYHYCNPTDSNSINERLTILTTTTNCLKDNTKEN